MSCAPIPREQVARRGSRKRKDTVSALAAPAVRPRAGLSGAIRHQQASTPRVQGPQGPGG
ncbi:Hypothetical protein HVIM_03987 [Roseomonas mucosa]|nr:Hypothetical protein HVIM_03987 [Roseomonas mucosa]QDD98394.1 Hypothetical protein ADP8_03987 [Roseomonas mucosa]UZO90588.1 Hypothetical protein RMP42_03987 [Roseomonas mucosa]